MVNTIIQDKEYVCHPQGAISYCPAFNHYDSILEGIDQLNCLENLDSKQTNNNDVSDCLIREHFKKYFNQLQLMDVPYSCLIEKLTECKKGSYNCNPSPCGHLGGFLKKLKDRKLEHLFSQHHGEEACNKLIY